MPILWQACLLLEGHGTILTVLLLCKVHFASSQPNNKQKPVYVCVSTLTIFNDLSECTYM